MNLHDTLDGSLTQTTPLFLRSLALLLDVDIQNVSKCWGSLIPIAPLRPCASSLDQVSLVSQACQGIRCGRDHPGVRGRMVCHSAKLSKLTVSLYNCIINYLGLETASTLQLLHIQTIQHHVPSNCFVSSIPLTPTNIRRASQLQLPGRNFVRPFKLLPDLQRRRTRCFEETCTGRT